MTNYRRSYDGTVYFFTVVTKDRQGFLCNEFAREVLRSAIRETRQKLPFVINGWVLLPDHLHCIWTLSYDDRDYSKRWASIKSRFSREYKKHQKPQAQSESATTKREAGFWQRRFWARQIMDERDYVSHMDYIHYNPVKHGLAEAPKDYPFSTFHRLVEAGIYASDWGAEELCFTDYVGSE